MTSDSLDSHERDLRRVLDRLRASGVKLNLKKTRLFRDRASFLGHVLVPVGVIPQREKIRNIKKWTTPTNKKELKSFLRFAPLYRKFIPNFATMKSSFYKLLKKGVPWVWDQAMTPRFEECKQLFREDAVLVNPDLRRPFIVYVDSSGHGLGAVLVQRNDSGEESVVTFASRSLTTCERNYSTTELECLAIIFAFSKFRPFLLGQGPTVRTDHLSLSFLKKNKVSEPKTDTVLAGIRV